ncbi:MAG TPA: N-acetylmuramoyl-L-alanine amidase [Bryobacteraceae bacterium]|nr:N-acetylmuramoyl-L-alanine amidase [Bryobacteraceae bacterium]
MVIRWSKKEPERIIGLLAGQIRDPVLRLRFLRRFAPRITRPRRRAVSRMALQIVPSVLLATGGSLLLTRATWPFSSAARATVVSAPPAMHAPEWPQPVWQIEQGPDSETWSNGLRIDNRFRAAGRTRSYQAPRLGDKSDAQAVRRSDPAGILFINLASNASPAALQSRYACNFLIDRFGRVYRIVSESEVANDGADAAWADNASRYAHLNQSFITVELEGSGAANIEQARGKGLLVQMLRSRFAIPAANVLTP